MPSRRDSDLRDGMPSFNRPWHNPLGKLNLPYLLVAQKLAGPARLAGDDGTSLAIFFDVVIATFRLFPAREQRRQLLSILRGIQGPTKVQPHCTSCQVYEEDGYEEAILYYERWDSEPEFKRHVRSDLYRRVLEAVEMSRRNPEIQFHQVSNTRSIDLLEELRSGLESGFTIETTTN